MTFHEGIQAAMRDLLGGGFGLDPGVSDAFLEGGLEDAISEQLEGTREVAQPGLQTPSAEHGGINTVIDFYLFGYQVVGDFLSDDQLGDPLLRGTASESRRDLGP